MPWKESVVMHERLEFARDALSDRFTMSEMVPRAKLLVYPGVGHAPHLEIATRFNRDLAEFVRSIR